MVHPARQGIYDIGRLDPALTLLVRRFEVEDDYFDESSGTVWFLNEYIWRGYLKSLLLAALDGDQDAARRARQVLDGIGEWYVSSDLALQAAARELPSDLRELGRFDSPRLRSLLSVGARLHRRVVQH